MPDKRKFTIKSCEVALPKGYNGGEFESDSPYRAAKKAVGAIYRQTKTTKKEVRFVLREKGVGINKEKEYHYVGIKFSYPSPIDTGRKDKNGDSILAKFEYSAKACR